MTSSMKDITISFNAFYLYLFRIPIISINFCEQNTLSNKLKTVTSEFLDPNMKNSLNVVCIFGDGKWERFAAVFLSISEYED